jgi:hypothetical protein
VGSSNAITVDIKQLKATMNKIRQRQAHSVMRKPAIDMT